jgi:RimJ/RimL family protein N-acetyltransferase
MKTKVLLRDVTDSDLSTFFEQQLDSEANRMAAFTRLDPADREAFEKHWSKILGSETATVKTVLCDGEVAGHVASFEHFGKEEVTYWIDRQYWNKGIATEALLAFLRLRKRRPLFARAAKDNVASVRVLEKCGFSVVGSDRGFAGARGEQVEEVIFELT